MSQESIHIGDILKTSTCRSCGAKIRWVKTEKGKNMPLDYDPAPKGTIMLQGDRVVLVGNRAVKRAYATGGALYTSHFATCPSAKEHRR
jgi:hypothetical protein